MTEIILFKNQKKAYLGPTSSTLPGHSQFPEEEFQLEADW